MDLLNKILKESVGNKYELFVDMDGVLCDFVKGYHKLTGHKIHSYVHIDDWSDVDNHPSFWEDLEWMPGGKELWAYVQKYKPNILSSPSESTTAVEQKTKWVERLPNKNNVYFARKDFKRKYAGPGKILIDDYKETIFQWIEDGGIGIWHTSTELTIKKLKNLGL